MGKSHKKYKNDRINAIRKQYDAFLEEDKNRRERNEYILSQLDKMRSSSALVPISAKANYHNMELNPSEMFMRQNNLRPKDVMRDTPISYLEKQNVTSGLLNTPVEELRILKEISKKYILIPKRTKPIENDFIYSKDINDDDWKTKYNILDDLKKLEKEGHSDPLFNQYNDDDRIKHNKRPDLSMHSNDCDMAPSLDIHPDNFDTPITQKHDELTRINKLKNESLVEQDKVTKQVNFNISELNEQSSEEINIPLQSNSINSEQGRNEDQQQPSFNDMQEYIDNPQHEDVTEKEKYNTESNEKDFNAMNNFNDNSQIYETSNVNDSTVYQENVEASEYNNISSAEPDKYIAPENIKPDITVAPISDQSIFEVKTQGPGTEEESVHLNQNIENQKDTSKIQDLTTTERVELYDDVDNNPEGQIVANAATFEEPHNYDSVQNTTLVDLENIQHPEHVEHESEINAFEAEQTEMFYSEQTDADAYGYNQGEGNTGEYAEGYEQNDQYAYYEGVQQEQAYATNINEHEESTERYDPHYNEQYEGSYENQQPDNTAGYDNANAYEQQQYPVENQQFENTDNYENQQENAHLYQQENVGNVNEVQENVLPQDDQMYDQNLYAEHTGGTQEHIEQQLIVEEGYTESSPVVTEEFQQETQGEIENVVDTTTPEEPVLDS